MSTEQYANNFATNLAAPMLIGATTLTAGVAAPAALQGGQFRIVIDSELLLVTAGASTTTWTVTRGVEGTTAAAHTAGATIAHTLTAASLLLTSVFDVRAYGTVDPTGATDSSAAMLAAVAAWYAAGGGTILIPGRMRVDSQIVIPNDGATYPTQPPLRLQGTGSHFSGRGAAIPAGAPFLDLRYAGANGKIVSTGLGLIDITETTFKDAAGTSTPFLYGTNTTWHVHDCSFIGSKVGVLCDQDAMVFGGTTNVIGNAINDSFQGYGTVIRDNYFGGIRRAVLGQVFFNGVVIRDNTVWATCGSNLAGGAAIELAGYSGDQSAGNTINSNLIEITNYPYAIKCSNTIQNTIAFNSVWDPGAGSLAAVRFEATATSNLVIDGYQPGSLAPVSPAVTGTQLNSHLAFDSGVIGEWPAASFPVGLSALLLTGGNATTPFGIQSLMANSPNGSAIVMNVEDGSGGVASAAYATGHTPAPAWVISHNLYSPGVNTIGTVGFQGTSPISKPTVTGSGSAAALASLLTALGNYGLVTDSSTAGLSSFIGHNSPLNCGAPANLVVSNAADFYAFTVDHPVTVTKVRFQVGVQSGNVDFGLYGATGTRLGSTGSTACPATGGNATINLTGSVSLVPGVLYYAAIAADNNTATFSALSAVLDASSWYYLPYSHMASEMGSKFPLPTSVSFNFSGTVTKSFIFTWE